MSGKIAWAAGLLLVAAGAALWLLGRSAPEAGRGAESRPQASAPAAPTDRPATAGPLQREAEEKAQAGRGAATGLEDARSADGGEATRGGAESAASGGDAQAKSVQRDLEFITRLFQPPGPGATDAEREAWENSPVSDLIYPNDHPCAGLPRDSVSPTVLVDAGKQALASMVLAHLPEAERPQCHLQGNWPFFPLNQCARGLDRENPESTAAFMSCLDGIPQDPKAYPADIWLPCPPSHPQATTPRQYFEDAVAAQVNQIFAGPSCQAN